MGSLGTANGWHKNPSAPVEPIYYFAQTDQKENRRSRSGSSAKLANREPRRLCEPLVTIGPSRQEKKFIGALVQ